MNTNNDPTIIVLQQNVGDEGVDDEENGDDDTPEEDKNDDSDTDSVETIPDNSLLSNDVVNDGEEQDRVMPDNDKTQGGNDQTEGSAFNEEGLRWSTRQRRPPPSYIPTMQGNKYQYQGTVNINVPEDANYRKFTETDQLLHVLGVAMVQSHGLHRDIKLFGQEARNAVQKEMQQHHDMETYIPVDPSKLIHDEKREAVESLCNIVKNCCGRVKARQCKRGRGGGGRRNLRYTQKGNFFSALKSCRPDF